MEEVAGAAVFRRRPKEGWCHEPEPQPWPGYLQIVWWLHSERKYLSRAPFSRWDGGANDAAHEIRAVLPFLFYHNWPGWVMAPAHSVPPETMRAIDSFNVNVSIPLPVYTESGAECSDPNRRMVDRTTAHYAAAAARLTGDPDKCRSLMSRGTYFRSGLFNYGVLCSEYPKR